LVSAPAPSQPKPGANKPISIVVRFASGGTTDAIARVVAKDRSLTPEERHC
jgi:tripartite-type tricarboxylate transporter receptor subunit TctC